jgi:glutamate synthase (NADPH/NADH) small chain
MGELTIKERRQIQRHPMPTQEPAKRRSNFSEVALGYGLEQAIAEANRCLGCKKAPCVAGCPVEVDIPDFIVALRDGDAVRDFVCAVQKG